MSNFGSKFSIIIGRKICQRMKSLNIYHWIFILIFSGINNCSPSFEPIHNLLKGQPDCLPDQLWYKQVRSLDSDLSGRTWPVPFRCHFVSFDQPKTVPNSSVRIILWIGVNNFVRFVMKYNPILSEHQFDLLFDVPNPIKKLQDHHHQINLPINFDLKGKLELWCS